MRKLVVLIALVLTMSTASAQMIGATNNQQTPRVQRVDNSPVFRPTGGSLRFSAGFPGLFTVSYNHYLTSYFMVGAGTGIGLAQASIYEYNPGYYHKWYSNSTHSYNYTWHDSYNYRENRWGYTPVMPIFVEMDLRTPKYKWSLFLNMKMGVNLFGYSQKSSYYYAHDDYFEVDVYAKKEIDYRKFLFSVSAGISYKNINFGGGYSNVDYFNAFLSYNLPVSTIEKWLFK